MGQKLYVQVGVIWDGLGSQNEQHCEYSVRVWQGTGGDQRSFDVQGRAQFDLKTLIAIRWKAEKILNQ